MGSTKKCKNIEEKQHIFNKACKNDRPLCFFDIQSDAIELRSRWRVGLDPNLRRKNIRSETIPKNGTTTQKLTQVASCPGGPTSSTLLQYYLSSSCIRVERALQVTTQNSSHWAPAVNRQPSFRREDL